MKIIFFNEMLSFQEHSLPLWILKKTLYVNSSVFFISGNKYKWGTIFLRLHYEHISQCASFKYYLIAVWKIRLNQMHKDYINIGYNSTWKEMSIEPFCEDNVIASIALWHDDYSWKLGVCATTIHLMNKFPALIFFISTTTDSQS